MAADKVVRMELVFPFFVLSSIFFNGNQNKLRVLRASIGVIKMSPLNTEDVFA